MPEHWLATRATSSAAATRYQLERRLGQGGMAEVFLARAHTSGGFAKRVVIKRILPTLAADATFVRMFLDEARLALALNHANIVQVFDVHELEGEFFYVMEFLDGCDVREITRRSEHFPPGSWLSQAITIIVAVCGGLHYAHGLSSDEGQPLRIVHRDVSPQNIFVTRDGNVKIIDFGIAKAANRLSVTTSMLKGKFGYMSPEQALNDPLDHRSDVFSTAIVLHELTSGARLFDGDSEYEVLKKLLELPIPSPSSFLPGYPAELERIVMKGLERDPAFRYQTARELQLDLERFAASCGLVLTPTVLGAFMLELFGQRPSAPQSEPVDRQSGENRADPARPAMRAGERETLSTTDVPVRPGSKRSGSSSLAIALAVATGVALLLVFAGLGLLGLRLSASKVPLMARMPVPDFSAWQRFAERSSATIEPVPESAPDTTAPRAPARALRRSAVKAKPKATPEPAPLSSKAVLDAPLPK